MDHGRSVDFKWVVTHEKSSNPKESARNHQTPNTRRAEGDRDSNCGCVCEREAVAADVPENQGLLMASNILVLEVLDIRAKGRSERRIVRSYELDQEINLKVTFADAPVLSTTALLPRTVTARGVRVVTLLSIIAFHSP